MLLYSADIMGAHCLKVKFSLLCEAALHRLKQCCRSGYIHSTFVCGLGMLLLQLYSLFSAHIMFTVFSLYLLSTARTLPAFGIMVQILYDTCNSALNVINYDCHSFDSPPFDILWLPNPLFIISQEGFLLKSFIPALQAVVYFC